MKKILITQHYSRNKGNVSLLYTLVEVLKKTYPDAEIVVSSFDPVDTAKIFGYRTCEWPFPTRLITDEKGIMKMFSIFKELFFLLVNVFLAVLVRFNIVNPSKFKGRFIPLKEIYESNVVISPGGHLFTNYNKFIPVFAHFFPCFLSVIMHRKYVVMAQTIGPFFGTWKFPTQLLTKFVLKHADFVTIRDKNSFDQISMLNVKIKDLRLTNEIVYLFPENVEKTASHPAKQKKVLGFTFHHIYYKRWMIKEDYIKRMVDFIDSINNKYDFDIQFISMEKDVLNKSDIPLLKEIKEKLKKNSNIEIVSLPQNSMDLLNIFGNLNYLVATKTHSVVYGLRKCIPTLAIAYEKKTEDFMRDFKQEEFSVQLSDFDSEFAFSIFLNLVEKETEVQNTIQNKLSEIQARSFENIELISRFL